MYDAGGLSGLGLVRNGAGVGSFLRENSRTRDLHARRLKGVVKGEWFKFARLVIFQDQYFSKFSSLQCDSSSINPTS
ncbi:MAG: hypothetical protein LUP97_08825, partial [Methanoregula sp.]|nr:hypothetical protein [Methanoregula sp.]